MLLGLHRAASPPLAQTPSAPPASEDAPTQVPAASPTNGGGSPSIDAVVPSSPEELGAAVEWFVGWLKDYGPRTLVTLFLAITIYVLLSRLLRTLNRNDRISSSDLATLRIVLRWAVVLLTAAAMLEQWGALENVWAAATTMIALVAIGFVAVWSVLSNVLCSFVLLATRPFRIGDEVSFIGDDTHGRVEQITLVYTLLRDDDGSQVLVPNNQFFQKIVRRHLNPAGERTPPRPGERASPEPEQVGLDPKSGGYAQGGDRPK